MSEAYPALWLRETLLLAIGYLRNAVYIVIFAGVIPSWVPPLRDSWFGRLVYSVYGPIMSQISRLISKSPLGGPGMMIDFSPIIALFLVDILRMILVSIIVSVF